MSSPIWSVCHPGRPSCPFGLKSPPLYWQPQSSLMTYSLPGGLEDHLKGEAHHPCIDSFHMTLHLSSGEWFHQSVCLCLSFSLSPPWAHSSQVMLPDSALCRASLLPALADAEHWGSPHCPNHPENEGELETKPELVDVVLRTSETLPWNPRMHRHTHTCHTHITPTPSPVSLSVSLHPSFSPPSIPPTLAQKTLIERGRPCGSSLQEFTQWPLSLGVIKQRTEKYDLILKQCS